MSVGVEYTIDELAREAGTTVRSLRVYHERGVLPPPQVKGRTGFYSPDHLNRVRTICRLLNRGIKLNGIRELLDAWDRGEGLGDVLGVADSEAAADTPDSELISATDLVQRYHDVPNGLARVVAAGMYEPVDAETYRVNNRLLNRVTERLATAGVPLTDVLDEVEQLRTDCERIARRHAALFHRAIWHPEHSPHNIAGLTELLAAASVVPGRLTADLVTQFTSRYLENDIAELSSRPTE